MTAIERVKEVTRVDSTARGNVDFVYRRLEAFGPHGATRRELRGPMSPQEMMKAINFLVREKTASYCPLTKRWYLGPSPSVEFADYYRHEQSPSLDEWCRTYLLLFSKQGVYHSIRDIERLAKASGLDASREEVKVALVKAIEEVDLDKDD